MKLPHCLGASGGKIHNQKIVKTTNKHDMFGFKFLLHVCSPRRSDPLLETFSTLLQHAAIVGGRGIRMPTSNCCLRIMRFGNDKSVTTIGCSQHMTGRHIETKQYNGDEIPCPKIQYHTVYSPCKSSHLIETKRTSSSHISLCLIKSPSRTRSPDPHWQSRSRAHSPSPQRRRLSRYTQGQSVWRGS